MVTNEVMRTFSLNSREFHEAVTRPSAPHMWAGGLPREPRMRDQQVIVEARRSKRRGR